jgi:ribonuclease HII
MRLLDFDLQHLEDVPAVIGVDEAGRGPLAGPVSAAAVYLTKDFYQSDWAAKHGAQINDSKQLAENTREYLFEAILQAEPGLIHFASFMADIDDIESLNILGATRKAMANCIKQLQSLDDCPFQVPDEGNDWLFRETEGSSVARILVDGKPLKPFRFIHTAIVKGDGKSLAIAMASIIAKVTRDRYMQKQAEHYPAYGFTSNKGYGTKKHIEALKAHGPCKIHRPSFLNNILST